jgi:hypothetical protein
MYNNHAFAACADADAIVREANPFEHLFGSGLRASLP